MIGDNSFATALDHAIHIDVHTIPDYMLLKFLFAQTPEEERRMIELTKELRQLETHSPELFKIRPR
jgi:hypothetical protein